MHAHEMHAHEMYESGKFGFVLKHLSPYTGLRRRWPDCQNGPQPIQIQELKERAIQRRETTTLQLISPEQGEEVAMMKYKVDGS
jgi:hypothetical protein